MTDVLLDPLKGHSQAPEDAPLCVECLPIVALNTNKSLWEWYEEPGNASRSGRFATAMGTLENFGSPNTILQGFDWGGLAANSLVVDVGGGIGRVTLKVVQRYLDLKYIVQDRPSFWSANNPSVLNNGTVKLIAHDFFTPQPVHNVAVFLCHMVMHDHGRDKALVILRNLRHAASPDTKLSIVDQIVPHACIDDMQADIPGAKLPVSPEPLEKQTL
ncbi:hypothetical protein AMATHDRAFT_42318 [Amanita thiersii Skay4041]|uniref:O-methyltransferase C-terminal domain-containing protein n=1 Tax=Amanita thiersii Skay4041 TaxID=703135 RepID=A0A2A9NJH0_9AGAR|nr:hypothetical protein AMATHDRAFT_42318 [Amanita thiersii Skay4041]